jgi:hypothetical protein
MTEATKIDFRHRRVSQVEDFTDIAEMLFPGNRNQQHAAACILFELKWAEGIVPSLSFLETKRGISRRTLQRARAKLARLGLIEHVSNLSARYAGRAGWKLSGHFTAALRQLADKVDHWRDGREPARLEKEEALLEVARPVGRLSTGASTGADQLR